MSFILRRSINLILYFISYLFLFGCNNNKLILNSVKCEEFYAENLKLKIKISSDENDVFDLKFWDNENIQSAKKISSFTKNDAVFYLSNLKSNTVYSYLIETKNSAKKTIVYHFKTSPLSHFIKTKFHLIKNSSLSKNTDFINGGFLINKREAPGALYIINSKGEVVWNHYFDNLGVRVAHFTKENTILSILGSEQDPTSYGRDIIEINSAGDTLLHLKKGEGDFKYIPHHEVFKDSIGNIVMLFLEKRILNLKSVGGNIADTVTGDGILVLDKRGKKIWEWSVFDVLDPLKEKYILKEKSDWLHANSLSIDYDGNYLISFFKSSQIWKINSKSGKVIWMFGENGNLKTDFNDIFSQSHAFHSFGKGKYLTFDNQLAQKTPRVHAYQINGNKMNSIINFSLPESYFTDRMGSSYFVNDTLLLTCCSKAGRIVLTNLYGNILWDLQTENLSPYRAEFVKQDNLLDYLNVK